MLFILLISFSLSNTYYGYLRTIEVSFCMDECGMYQIESEIDGGFGAIPIVINNDIGKIIIKKLGKSKKVNLNQIFNDKPLLIISSTKPRDWVNQIIYVKDKVTNIHPDNS